jgi:D-arabinose 1-dehydrogenase-like Zn-dependent alcohol dehydrogenase
MTKMRAMIVPEVRGQFRMEEFDLPKPGRHEVLIRVHACGVCHSDSFTVEGLAPGITYPRIPGHEVIGVIEALGPDVDGWNVGERAGVGWFGGSCGIAETVDEAMLSPARLLPASPASPATEVTPRICSRLPRRWPRFPPS